MISPMKTGQSRGVERPGRTSRAGPRHAGPAETIERAIAWFSRTTPRFKGKQRLLRWLYPNEGPHCHPVAGVVRTRAGFRIHCETSSFIEWALFFLGEIEPETADLLDRTIRPGWVCIDAGANIGLLSLVMARATGPAGAVYAFEPNPEIRPRLDANIRLNGAAQVRIEEICLGSTNRAVDFYVPDTLVSNVGQASIYLDHHPELGERVRRISVPMVRLDDYVASHALTSVHLLKIDVEGGEIDLLRGATETLGRFGPVIVFEANAVTQAMAGSNLGELFVEIEKHGYSIYRRDRRGVWGPLSKEARTRAERQPDYLDNLLASRSPLPEALQP